jgi:hypothetical protein
MPWTYHRSPFSDNRYSQLHKPIKASPIKEAGINRFKSISPFKVTVYLTTYSALVFHWASLFELNDDIAPFSHLSVEGMLPLSLW